MNVRNTVKSLLKSVVPEKVVRLKRCIGIVRSLHKRFDSAGYVPTQEDMNQMALIRRTYKKIAVLQMPCRNIGGMGLMYQWLCEHRASDTLYLFYREHFDHSKKIPNVFLEKLICRDLVDMEENLSFWLRVLKMCFWKVESQWNRYISSILCRKRGVSIRCRQPSNGVLFIYRAGNP